MERVGRKRNKSFETEPVNLEPFARRERGPSVAEET
jgi:hypothetical protein